MSDSEIVNELVTSKYKIAERNRLAKYRFLTTTSTTNMNSVDSNSSTPILKRHDSEPAMAKTEKADVKPVDISVPGTPISSRYLKSLRKSQRGRVEIETDSEGENENDEEIAISKEQQQQQLLLQESLKKFNADMENLQKEETSHDDDNADTLQKYFDSSDKTKTYHRDFSDVAAEITINKKDPSAISRVEQYFKESARRGSLTRDFNEVVQSFDPQNPTGRDQFKCLSKPGTPISSKFVKVEKVKLEPLNIKNLEKILDSQLISPSLVRQASAEAPEKPKRIHPVPLSPTITPPTPSFNTATIPDSPPKPADESPSSPSKEEEEEIITKQVKSQTKLKRKESNVSISSTRSDISVPGTPVDSRHIFRKHNDDDADDTDSDMEIIDSSEIKALAQEFSEKIGELVQKTKDDVEKEEEEEKQQVDGGEKKLLIIYDDEIKPQENNKNDAISRVKEYLEKSEQEKSYQRTFSEVANFNEPSTDVKEKVEKYFKDSEEKKSFTRGFSEAINYVEPINIEKLFQPGTPVSSKTVECVRKKQNKGEDLIMEEVDPETMKGMEAFLKAHEALHNPLQDFKVDKYFEESKERKTLRRDFSEVFGELGSSQNNSTLQNPDVKKYFEQSEAQKSFQRQFSEALQTLPPRIKDILIEEVKKKRADSDISSAVSEPDGSKKSNTKYTVDKYFAASLYRTAFQRRLVERRGSEPNKRLAIVEDEYVFGETDLLRGNVFQDDDATPIHQKDIYDGSGSENFEQQNVQFWRDFLKPYNLNLPTDIVMRDELIDKYTKYSLE